MAIAITLAGDVNFQLRPLINKFKISTWIAVDGGYNHLYEQKITPEIIIGDMDSVTYPFEDSIVFPREKDDPDFKLAIDYVNKKYPEQQIIVVGVIASERIEHFISNLKLMTDNMIFIMPKNIIIQLGYGTHKLKKTGKYFSLFAKEDVKNLTIKNAKWELENFNLDVNNPLTISNEFIKDEVIISFDSGIIQVYLANNIF